MFRLEILLAKLHGISHRELENLLVKADDLPNLKVGGVVGMPFRQTASSLPGSVGRQAAAAAVADRVVTQSLPASVRAV